MKFPIVNLVAILQLSVYSIGNPIPNPQNDKLPSLYVKRLHGTSHRSSSSHGSSSHGSSSHGSSSHGSSGSTGSKGGSNGSGTKGGSNGNSGNKQTIGAQTGSPKTGAKTGANGGTTQQPNEINTKTNGNGNTNNNPRTSQNTGNAIRSQNTGKGPTTTGNPNTGTGATAPVGGGKTTGSPNTARPAYVLTGRPAGGVTQYITRQNGGGGFNFNPFIAGFGVGMLANNLHHNAAQNNYVYLDKTTTYTVSENALMTIAPSLIETDLSKIQTAALGHPELQKFLSDYYSSINTQSWVSAMSLIHTVTQTVNVNNYLSFITKSLPHTASTSEYSQYLVSMVEEFKKEANNLTSISGNDEASQTSLNSKNSHGGARKSFTPEFYGLTAIVSTFILALL